MGAKTEVVKLKFIKLIYGYGNKYSIGTMLIPLILYCVSITWLSRYLGFQIYLTMQLLRLSHRINSRKAFDIFHFLSINVESVNKTRNMKQR